MSAHTVEKPRNMLKAAVPWDRKPFLLSSVVLCSWMLTRAPGDVQEEVSGTASKGHLFLVEPGWAESQKAQTRHILTPMDRQTLAQGPNEGPPSPVHHSPTPSDRKHRILLEFGFAV